MNTTEILHAKLAVQGIRMFSFELDGDNIIFVHPAKTVSGFESKATE